MLVVVVVVIKEHQAVLEVPVVLLEAVQAAAQGEPESAILVVEAAVVDLEPLVEMAQPRLAQPGWPTVATAVTEPALAV